ncbi:type II CAAX endopeptidase family protein [Halobellus litoreus]|uniref:CPBP family intramembrane glutamic endopeptidase n=1 Tax=Halobellus litoreus TaxID=755310 RepID=A0ABD6DZN9_9EURY|nr:type II CAAX endopeptidase family protein [Halobellus litoreus]
MSKPDVPRDADSPSNQQSVATRGTDRRRQFTRTLLAPLWNRTEHRPRALWRILGAFVLVAVGSQVLPPVLFGNRDLPPSVLGAAQNAFTVIIVLLVAVVWAWNVDRRRLTDYGLDVGPEWIRDAAAGAVIAFLVWGMALGVHLSVGWAHISAVLSPGVAANALPVSQALIAFSVQFLLVGIWEELLFRGIVLTNAAEGLQLRWLSERGAVLAGLGTSSLLFGVVHVDQAASLPALAFWVLMGVVLGSAYVVTDSLAVPIGLHSATNLAFNNVYGLSNVRPETAEIAATVLRPEFTGPARFVAVSGLVNVGAVVLIAVLSIGYVTVQRRGLRMRLSPADSVS